MTKKILIILALIIQTFLAHSQVVINEFSTSNTTGYGGGTEDWVEFYNTSSTAANIGGFYLSDSPTNPTKWQIPAGTSVAGNSYYTILLSGNNVTTGAILETNFKLTQMSQEWLIFSDASATALESYQMLTPTAAGHSRGKSPNGSNNWAYFTTPTPNAINSTTAYSGYADKPQFIIPAGFYTGTPNVALFCSLPSAQIRYTIDGSEPTSTSTLYNLPITVTSTTIIRAQTFPNSGTNLLPSFIENNTYFINVNHTVPVVSVAGDYGSVLNGIGTFAPLNNSFANPNGITSSIEYFDVSQTLQWESTGDMRRHGNDSWAYPQKGIRFHSQDRYGYASTIDYPMMQRSNRQKYDVIILKAGASDNYPDGGNSSSFPAHIRDAFVQTFAEQNGIRVDTRRYEPCVLYVNGKYWGVYELRERVDTDYTNFYYNQPDDKVDMLRYWGGMIYDAGSDTAWFNLRDFIINNNMATPTNYQHVVDRLDVNSFIDYFIYNQFLVNTDVFNWNTHWWRGRKNAGVKWRFVLWDMDNTYGLGQNFSGLPASTGGTTCNSSPCGYEDPNSNVNDISQVQMFAALKQNPIFMQTYANRYAYLNTHVLTCEKLIPHLDSLVARITPEFPGQVARWTGSMAEWQTNVQKIRDFLLCRCGTILNSLVDCTSPTLSGPYEVCFSSEPPGIAVITFDSTLVTNTENCFTYFGGANIPLTVVSNNPNYIFQYWQLPNGTVIDTDTLSPIAMIQLVDSGIIVAHFKLTLYPSNDTSVCVGQPVHLSVNGATTYQWIDVANPNTILSTQSNLNIVPTATTYYKIISNIGNDSIKVTIKPIPNVNLGLDSLQMCEGDSVVHNLFLNNAHYLWNDGDTNFYKTISKAGIYAVQLKLNGCVNSDTVEYQYYKYPKIKLGNDTLLCYPQTILLSPTKEKDVKFLWSTGDTANAIVVINQSEYIVNVSRHLCVSKDTINVSTEVCIPCKVYIPNAFSPNADDKNDKFFATFREDKDCTLKDFRLDIYNKWGALVFATNTIKNGWIPPIDATDNIFNFVISYSFDDKGEYNTFYDSGTITIIK